MWLEQRRLPGGGALLSAVLKEAERDWWRGWERRREAGPKEERKQEALSNIYVHEHSYVERVVFFLLKKNMVSRLRAD